jgi:hypothetical protein
MDKKHPRSGEGEFGREASPVAEKPAFSPEEMVACGKCGRANPPNRFRCLYCAADLGIETCQAESARLVLRKLEGWEKGFNVIFHPGVNTHGRETIAKVAKALAIEKEALEDILGATQPLPVARVEGEGEAGFVESVLRENGIESSIVTDRSLAEEIPPKRLRTVHFENEGLRVVLFNTGEIGYVKYDDLALIVIGALFEKKTETIEKRKKKGESKKLDEFEISSDELLIDIYGVHDPAGWRIPTKGFDFSCLGNEKGMLAVQNIRRLTEKLRAFAPNSKFVDGYLGDRGRLGYIWDVEQKKDFQGLKRSGFGKVDMGKIELTSNQGQFTKYSRLQWQLL